MPPASSTMASFAHITAPASRSFLTTVASWSNTWLRYGSAPHVVGTPFVASRSFTPYGMPCSGPRILPFAISASAARASASALSRITVTTAFNLGPSVPSRSRHVSVSFTDVSFFAFTRAASSRTGVYSRSESAMGSSGGVADRSGAERDVGLVAVREFHPAQALTAGEIAVEVGGDAVPLRLVEAVRVARAQDLGEEPGLARAVLRPGRGGRRRGR